MCERNIENFVHYISGIQYMPVILEVQNMLYGIMGWTVTALH